MSTLQTQRARNAEEAVVRLSKDLDDAKIRLDALQQKLVSALLVVYPY